MLAKAVVVLLGLVFALLLSELALRLFTREEQMYDVEDDAYWKALLARSRDTAPGTEDASTEPDASLGWRMKPNFARGDARHNSRGYRDEREFDAAHEGPRILAIGASMAYGLGVDAAHTLTGRLEASTGVQAINAGVNAYGADQALLFWEQEGRALRPDVVVLVYHVDDFYRNGLTVRDAPKPYFVPDGDGFRLAGVPVPSLDAFVASGGLETGAHLRIQQALAWLYRKTSSKLGGGDVARLERLTKLNRYILERLRDSVRASGARLVVAIAGHCADGSGAYLASERAIVEACQSLGIDVLDLVADMRGPDYASYYGTNCHWSEAGHAFAAEKVEAELSLRKQPTAGGR